MTEFDDVAGPAQASFQYKLAKGDKVVVGAIGSGVALVTVNGVLVYTITATSVAGIIGFYS